MTDDPERLIRALRQRLGGIARRIGRGIVGNNAPRSTVCGGAEPAWLALSRAVWP